MRAYLESFVQEFDYPKDDAAFLLSAYDKIASDASARAIWESLIEAYGESLEIDYRDALAKAEKAGESVGVHPYTAGLLLYICFSKHLKTVYRERGISERIYHDSMLDLRYKLKECKLVKHIVGSFVAWWFAGFFKLRLFALGRLQFETVTYRGEDYEKKGRILKNGDRVINVHIPRSEKPLTKEATDDSYAQAAAFFAHAVTGETTAFVCDSWLLLEDTLEVFPKHTNTYRFIHEYDVVRSEYSREGSYGDAWRLFNMDYSGNIEDYPENTCMCRAYKDYLRRGGRMGSGFGILIYE